MKFEQLIELFRETHKGLQAQVVHSVDIVLVVRNWLFGRYIVEYEQHGSDRAEYGMKILKNISKALSERIGRGFSVDNLELMRRFFMAYQNIVTIDEKSETLFRISKAGLSETVSRISPALSDQSFPLDTSSFKFLTSYFTLGWSHYVTLMTINKPEVQEMGDVVS